MIALVGGKVKIERSVDDGWKLWLDDQLDDGIDCRKTPEGYLGAKSSRQAYLLVLEFGMPTLIDFDHDLGGNDDALVFLKMLYNAGYEPTMLYKIHSANPIGAEKIKSYIESWKRAVYFTYDGEYKDQ